MNQVSLQLSQAWAVLAEVMVKVDLEAEEDADNLALLLIAQVQPIQQNKQLRKMMVS
ncbi:hypothetical protein D3C75_1250050 [compost metagenome]